MDPVIISALIASGAALAGSAAGIIWQARTSARSARLALLDKRMEVAAPVTRFTSQLAMTCRNPHMLARPLGQQTGPPDLERVDAALRMLEMLSLSTIPSLEVSIYLFPPEVHWFIRETAELGDQVIALTKDLRERVQAGEPEGEAFRALKAEWRACELHRLRCAETFIRHLGHDRFASSPGIAWKARREFDRTLSAEINELANRGPGGRVRGHPVDGGARLQAPPSTYSTAASTAARLPDP